MEMSDRASLRRLASGFAIETEIRPELVQPGKYLKIRPGPFSNPLVIYAFNSKEDRDAWLDAIDEKIFDLNHPVRK